MPTPRAQLLTADDLTVLQSHRLLLDQLVAFCTKGERVYAADPRCIADINRTSKRLCGALDVALRRQREANG